MVEICPPSSNLFAFGEREFLSPQFWVREMKFKFLKALRSGGIREGSGFTGAQEDIAPRYDSGRVGFAVLYALLLLGVSTASAQVASHAPSSFNVPSVQLPQPSGKPV